MARKKRVLSGMRPTGRLHLGHYFGALQNWLKLQEEYDCYFFVADWHALTTHYAEDTKEIAENTLQVAIDWLSVGLDPGKSTIFVQSRVLEHAELHLLLSMVTPLEWLARVPTYKEQIEQLKEKDLSTYGFLGYPLLQTADIVIYDADLVPVGEDQVPHIELAREVVRRFNTNFGLEVKDEMFLLENKGAFAASMDLLPKEYEARRTLKDREMIEFFKTGFKRSAREMGLPNFLRQARRLGVGRFFKRQRGLREPAAMLTETPRLPGTDGRRMAKSYGNAIWLSESDENINVRVHNMMTDPQRVRRTDPGRPEVCPVFAYHKLFSTPETIAWSEQGCRTAGIGCVECKAAMAEGLIRWITPIRDRREKYEADPAQVEAILAEGSKKAQRVARKTMRRVRKAIFGSPAGPGSTIGSPARKADVASGS